MFVSSVNPIAFGNTKTKKDERKEAAKEAVTGGGAVAGAATITRNAKAAKGSFDVVKNSKNISNGIKGITNTTTAANNAVKETVGLWGKVKENAAWLTKKITDWGSKFKNMKYVKPLISSRAFKLTICSVHLKAQNSQKCMKTVKLNL